MGFLRWVWCFGSDVMCWLVVLVSGLVVGGRLSWVSGYGLWRESSREVLPWGFNGGTFGHGGVLAKGKLSEDSKTLFHEKVHVRQYEVVMLIVTVLFSIGVLFGASWKIYLLMPIMGGVPYVCAMFVSWLRGGRPYRDNVYERSAYAQTKKWSGCGRG